ncbi:MAG: four helix bundle protein [Pyrinomonadaceae bacterium]
MPAKTIYLVSGTEEFAEGQGRRTDKDLANFLNMTLGSIAETNHICTLLGIWATSRVTF